jgi:hypothetical protein
MEWNQLEWMFVEEKKEKLIWKAQEIQAKFTSDARKKNK